MTKPRSPIRQTSEHVLSRGQKIGGVILLLLLVLSLVLWPVLTLKVLAALGIVFFAVYIAVAKILLHIASGSYRSPALQPVAVDDPDLPIYTILVPLFEEPNMLAGLVRAIDALEYPKSKMQVLLLIEDRDNLTRSELIGMDLGPWYETVLVPDIKPYGKPKALNMGLARARGAICTIFDAEDLPDPHQLLEVVAAFRSTTSDVGCVQARLVFWNQETNPVTRLYWAEYAVHYYFVLPGLAQLGLIPPLGGTSNHFRVDALRKIAIARDQLPAGAEGIGGWDPWNVTEDAELAGALAAHGYRVLLIDAVTREEATRSVGVAAKQRRRWLKGYLQTGLVYLRSPLRQARAIGPVKWFVYVLTVLGTPVSLVLNPLFWLLTVVYFLAKANWLGEASTGITSFVEALFPGTLLYVGAVLILVNIFLYFQLIYACLRRGGEASVPFMALNPAWALFTSWQAIMATVELAIPALRHKWWHTPHGHEQTVEESDQPILVKAGLTGR